MNRVLKVADDLGTLMQNARIFPATKKVNWTPIPDPVTKEEEVNIKLKWTADAHTHLAIERQTRLMGFQSADDYLHQTIAAAIAKNEADTSITSKGHLVSGSLCGSDGIGISQDV
jgi:hypothetical protein